MNTDYLAALFALATQLESNVFLFAGVFARVAAIAYFAPAIGELAVPPRIRLSAAAAITMVIVPMLEAPKQDGAAIVGLVAVLAGEIAVGLLIGFTLRLAIFTLQMLGSIAAQAMSMSQLFGPGLGHDQESPLSTILIAAGLALACAGGLHLMLAAAVAETYEVIPLGARFPAGDAAAHAAAQSAKALSLAFGLAAPFVVLGVAYSVALAASNRAMPQLAAIFVGAPAIVLAGLTLFAGAASVILSRWSALSAELVAAPLVGLP